jgi:ATP-binding cassette subfamily B (MDR/TAP) protein 1
MKNHAILLLDEASSSLDTKSEQQVQDALSKIMKPKSQTTIVIAHRLSTVRNADRIAVIAGGVLCEIGTWDQLMSRPGGRFRRMSLFQSLDGSKQDVNSILTQVQLEYERGHEPDRTYDFDIDQVVTEESIKLNKISKRARLMARDDRFYLAVGSGGAIIAGVGFPATGVSLLHSYSTFLRCYSTMLTFSFV